MVFVTDMCCKKENILSLDKVNCVVPARIYQSAKEM